MRMLEIQHKTIITDKIQQNSEHETVLFVGKYHVYAKLKLTKRELYTRNLEFKFIW